MGSQKMLQPTNASGRKQRAEKIPKRSRTSNTTHLYRPDTHRHAGQQVNGNQQLTDSIDTPCRQLSQLELKPKAKQPKLLGSKSLSQLISRKLIFRTTSAVAPTAKNETSTCSSEATMRSFPNEAMTNESMGTISTANHLQSAPMLYQPGRSHSSSQVVDFRCAIDDCSLGQPNFSPIVSKTIGPARDTGDIICFSSTRADIGSTGSPQAPEKSSSNRNSDSHENKDGKKAVPKKTGNKFKPIKNTTMVLRDMKNSIGLRMRAKHDSKAFAKLTNELATPPTKLYSPFNINDSCASKQSRLTRKSAASPGNNTSFVSSDSGLEADTPKQRIALQHKKHLMQANKFANFISPTGKLRETVKDVEHFQKCIEDISRAIKAREESK